MLTIELSADRQTFFLSSGGYTRELSSEVDLGRIVFAWLSAQQNHALVQEATRSQAQTTIYTPPTRTEIAAWTQTFTRAKAAPKRKAHASLILEDLGL